MYTLKCDGVMIAQTAAEEMAFESGTLQQRVNTADMLTATLRPANPHLHDVGLRRSQLVLERSGTEIFRGQAVSLASNEYGFVEISGLSDMSYLQDVQIAPFEFTGTVAALVAQILAEFLQKADTARRIYMGEITVSAPASIEQSESGYRSAWDIISGLVDDYGGYLSIRTSDSGLRVLDWKDDSGHFADQTIMWGDNLLSLQIEEDTGELVNAIIAEGNDDLITTVTDTDSITAYGVKWGHIKYDADTSAQLEALAQKDLDLHKHPARSVSGSAIDRWDEGEEGLRIGDFVRVISDVHLVDEWLMVSELRHDLAMDHPLQVTLGRIRDGMTNSGRTALVNAWIVTAQGRTPPVQRAIDIENYYAKDSDSLYAVALVGD